MSISREIVEALSNRPLPPEGLTRPQWEGLIRTYLEAMLDARAEIQICQSRWRQGSESLHEISPSTRARCWKALNAIYSAGVNVNVGSRLVSSMKMVDNGPLIYSFDEYVKTTADSLSEYDRYMKLQSIQPEDAPW